MDEDLTELIGLYEDLVRLDYIGHSLDGLAPNVEGHPGVFVKIQRDLSLRCSEKRREILEKYDGA